MVAGTCTALGEGRPGCSRSRRTLRAPLPAKPPNGGPRAVPGTQSLLGRVLIINTWSQGRVGLGNCGEVDGTVMRGQTVHRAEHLGEEFGLQSFAVAGEDRSRGWGY